MLFTKSYIQYYCDSKSMPIWFTGFNGFEQWPNKDLVFKEFEDLQSTLIKIKDESKIFKIHFGWSYNIIQTNKTIYVSGFCSNRSQNFIQLRLPANLDVDANSLITGNDYFIFIASGKTLWQYGLKSATDECLIPIAEEIENTILKICCNNAFRMVLTEHNKVFQLPNAIETKHCIGKVIDIACGNEHYMLLTNRGCVYTWGNGSRCQLGHGDIENKDAPELLEALVGINICKIACGGWHCCALSSSGDLYSWGWNDKGQLGVRTCSNPTGVQDQCPTETASRLTPTLIDLFDESNSVISYNLNIIDIACGNKHTIVMLDDYSIWASGCNDYCQLGIDCNTIKSQLIFIKVFQGQKGCNVICGPWSSSVLLRES